MEVVIMAIYVPFNEGQQAEEYKAKKAAAEKNQKNQELIRTGIRQMHKGERMLDDKEYAHKYSDAYYDAGKEVNTRRKQDKDRYPSTKELLKDPNSDKSIKMSTDISNAADAIERQNRRHPGNYNPKQSIKDKLTKKASRKNIDKTIDRLNEEYSESSIFEAVRLI